MTCVRASMAPIIIDGACAVPSRPGWLRDANAAKRKSSRGSNAKSELRQILKLSGASRRREMPSNGSKVWVTARKYIPLVWRR